MMILSTGENCDRNYYQQCEPSNPDPATIEVTSTTSSREEKCNQCYNNDKDDKES